MSVIRVWSLPESMRWGACFMLALCAHVGTAAALLARWQSDGDLMAGAPVIMLELAPVPIAPAATPNDMTSGPQQAEAQIEPDPVKPVDVVALQPAPQAEMPMTPPPKPIEKSKDKRPKQKHASVASTPSPADTRAKRMATPVPGAPGYNPNARSNWKSQLYAQLERHKREPPGERGVAQLAFSVDRSGGVHHARILQSSGSSALDRETLQLLERAQPLPPPPADISGAQVEVEATIRYNFR